MGQREGISSRQETRGSIRKHRISLFAPFLLKLIFFKKYVRNNA